MANKYHRQNFDKGGGADTGRMGEIKSKVTLLGDQFRKMSEKINNKKIKVFDKETNKNIFINRGELIKNLDRYNPATNTERLSEEDIKRAKKLINMKKGGRAALKRGGGKFPDYSGDGKITMRDILMGRGVIPKKKKKKMMAKKFKSPMEKAIRGKKA